MVFFDRTKFHTVAITPTGIVTHIAAVDLRLEIGNEVNE